MKVLVYTYYSRPWGLSSGDDVRVHSITRAVRKCCEGAVVYNLSHLVREEVAAARDGVVYVSIPRRIYSVVSRLLRWRNIHDLNPLMKLTHYMDEFIAAVKLASTVRGGGVMYVFGSMSLLSLFARVIGRDAKIIYDPLANYAQTLYLRSRRSAVEILRYGLYLALHKLQLRSSDCVIYPSQLDKENAERSFTLPPATVVPNPYPVCYRDLDEYMSYRKGKEGVPYFVFAAGGRNRGNEEAVRLVIQAFNEIPPESFRLTITGPWEDMRDLVKNDSIELVGFVPHERMKEILARSDYGLSPIFSHSAGTFIKVLAYMAAGLDIIATPMGIYGLPFREQGTRLYLVRRPEDLGDAVKRAMRDWERSGGAGGRGRPVVTCDQAEELIRRSLREAISFCLRSGERRQHIGRAQA